MHLSEMRLNNKRQFVVKLPHSLLRGAVILLVNFNDISVILLWSVLLVDETGVPGENH
jgi:hypothetical protein